MAFPKRLARNRLLSKYAPFFSHEGKTSLLGLASLLSSGILASFGFMLLTSERVPQVSGQLVVFTVLFVQWETLGLTVAKLGADQFVFATTSRDPLSAFDFLGFLLRTTLPLSIFYALGMIALFSPLAALAIGVSILLDVNSVLRTAFLNAQRRFVASSIGTLLNYPLFFVAFFILVAVGLPGTLAMLGSFLLGSAARCTWLTILTRGHHSSVTVPWPNGVSMGIQQCLNYILFKADQLWLSILPYVTADHLSTGFANHLLFLARFPEFFGGVLLSVGAVVFPIMSREAELNGLRGVLERSAPLAAVTASLVAIGFLVYNQYLWSGSAWLWWSTVPFLVNALLGFPVNFVTYTMFRREALRRLISCLAIATLAGLVFFPLLFSRLGESALIYIVPAQLACFLGFNAVIGRSGSSSCENKW